MFIKIICFCIDNYFPPTPEKYFWDPGAVMGILVICTYHVLSLWVMMIYSSCLSLFHLETTYNSETILWHVFIRCDDVYPKLFTFFILTWLKWTSPPQWKPHIMLKSSVSETNFFVVELFVEKIDLTKIPDSTMVIAFNCWLQMLFGHSWSWTTLFLEDKEKQIMESASFLRDFSELNSSNCPPLCGYLLEELKLILVSSNSPDTAWSFFLA